MLSTNGHIAPSLPPQLAILPNEADHAQTNISYSPEQNKAVLHCRCGEGISKWHHVEVKSSANYWKAQHDRAVQREEAAKAEIEFLKAKIRLREMQFFGKKSERTAKSEHGVEAAKTPAKKRGQQRGLKKHGRQQNQDLPVREEVIDLPPAQRCCKTCQQPYHEFPGTEDSELLEIDVKAYKRRIKRKRYSAGCSCPGTPGMISAPPVGKLIPHGKIGVSLWVHILLDKFEYYCPTNRLIREMKNRGLALPQGTVTDGLSKMEPFLKPVYEAIAEYNRVDESLWNADETRWEVFAELEGKVGHRWYLWVFAGVKSVVFFIDPTRSKTVPQHHLGNAIGKLVVDRYKAYFTLLKSGNIVLAFCWAHVRRDFLTHAKTYPEEENWAAVWVREIRNLYYINARRASAIAVGDNAYQNKMQRELEEALTKMDENSRLQQADPMVSKAAKKILASLDYHWDGLTVFSTHAEVAIDNNRAERMLRGPVVCRKGFYGSGSRWSALLAAMMFSILHTLKLWAINPHTWMTLFLQACADNQGKLPDDWQRFLPWKMSKEQLNLFSQPLICDSS